MPDPHVHPWHQAPEIATLAPDSYTAQRLVRHCPTPCRRWQFH